MDPCRDCKSLAYGSYCWVSDGRKAHRSVQYDFINQSDNLQIKEHLVNSASIGSLATNLTRSIFSESNSMSGNLDSIRPEGGGKKAKMRYLEETGLCDTAEPYFWRGWDGITSLY